MHIEEKDGITIIMCGTFQARVKSDQEKAITKVLQTLAKSNKELLKQEQQRVLREVYRKYPVETPGRK